MSEQPTNPTTGNPLTVLPPKVRLYVYGLLMLAGLVLGAWQAADGDWLQFAGYLLGSLGFGTAASNTPARILGKA